MKKQFGENNWKDYVPVPILEDHPEYSDFYYKAWELAFKHIKNLPGMPQNPYMDEAFCETQIWIWDTCFMSLFCKYARDIFPGAESFNNFYGVLYEGKHLPKVMPPENEPEWTLAKFGTPYEIQVHIADNPPLFAWAEYENALMDGNIGYIKDLLYKRKILQKHYNFIENLHDTIKLDGVLNPTCLIAEKYGYKWEGGRSGMDNTPRGRKGEHAFEDRPNNPDMLWIDAICQQALTANIISKMYTLAGDKIAESEWNEKYSEKKKIINNLYWDNKDKFYYDIDCNTHKFYKVKTIASYWTLLSETADKDRAKSLVEESLNPKEFGGFVPLISLARSDSDYVSDGKYWRGSLWLPTSYMALRGFTLYGFHAEAHKNALKIFKHMYKTYTNYTPHTIWECYNPEEHKPATYPSGKLARKDFCGWSALGPISIYIEYVLGFHIINAFEKTIKWSKPTEFKKKIGLKNLRFGNIITDIIADENICRVTSNESYTLEINEKKYKIYAGENEILF